MTGRTILSLMLVAAGPARALQAPNTVLAQAESLRLAGRPWHAAQALLAAAARSERPNAEFIVRGARAELLARRYDRAKSLLAGQPWLADYENGEALEVLATAEMALGNGAAAAPRFVLARARSGGLRATLLAARAAVAFEAAGALDSAARYYALARDGGIAAVDPWLRLRLARVTRDTTAAVALLTGLPAPAVRLAPVARARALLAAGDSAAALDALALTGQLLEVARIAVVLGDTVRARGALYDLMTRAPESDDAAAGVALAQAGLPPRLPAERVALARTLRLHGDATAARIQVQRAVAQGDSTAVTLILYGELLVQANRLRDAELAYRAAARDSVRELGVAQPVRLHQQLAIQNKRDGSRIALRHRPLHLDAGCGRIAMEAQRAGQRDALGGKSGGQARLRERHPGRRVVRFRRPGHEIVERAPSAHRVAQHGRDPRHLEQLPGQREGVERRCGVSCRQQGAGARDGRESDGRRGEASEERDGGGSVAGDAREAESQPGIDGGDPPVPGQRVVACRAVQRAGRFEGDRRTGGEQRGAEAAAPGAGQHEAGGRCRAVPQRHLRGGQHLQRLAVLVVGEPGLTGEQALGPIVAAREELRPRAPHDELGVGALGSGGGGQERLRGMPWSPGEPEGFRLCEHGVGGLQRPRGARRDEHETEDGPPGHCIRRTRANTRWNSERELGVSRKRPKPDSSRNRRLTRSWM